MNEMAFEDGELMLFEDGSVMLYERITGAWSDVDIPTGVWVDTDEPTGA